MLPYQINGGCVNQQSRQFAVPVENVGMPTFVLELQRCDEEENGHCVSAAPVFPANISTSVPNARPYFFALLAFCLFSTTTCAAANREIGTRNGDALT